MKRTFAGEPNEAHRGSMRMTAISRWLAQVGCAAALATGCSDGAGAKKELPAARDDRSPCAALCERIAECGAPPDSPGVQACTSTCEEDPRQLSGPCREPRIAYERCFASLSCDDARSFTSTTAAKNGPCAAETVAVLACEPEEKQPPFIHFQF